MYVVEGSDLHPSISMDFSSGFFRIAGKSIPENPWQVYQPVLDHLIDYSNRPQTDTVMEIELEFFNTSTSKMLLDIIGELERLHKTGDSNVLVKWIYTDEDMLEVGENFKHLMDLPFDLISLE